MSNLSTPLWLRSSLLTQSGFASHGFTTTQGGVSEAPFASWNFSTSTGDSSASVEANYSILASALDVRRSSIKSVHQVHSNRVVHVRDAEQITRNEQADAVLTGVLSTVVAIKTADCVPILMADPASRWVAAIHAGWRGVVGGIALQALSLLRDTHPHAQPLWAIGPHICPTCFQVGPEVAEVFPEQSSPDPSEEGKYRVDLRKAVVQQLVSAGVPETHIDHVNACTVCDPHQRFFSHRGHKGRTGRLLNFIACESLLEM